MKILQTITALLTLFALLMPCAHADEHHHHDMTAAELCAADHAECHACSDEPCTDGTDDVVPLSSALEIPEPQFHVLCELLPEHDSYIELPLPLGEFFHLLTVQLLI